MPKQITSIQVTQKPDILLDRDAFVPPGVDGITLKEIDLVAASSDEFPAESDFDNPLEEDPNIVDLPPEAGDELFVPEDIVIVSQNVRFGPDGNQVVDVVLDILDAPEDTLFDVRITNVS